MILTCPECATRYFVDDAKLGAGGRTVRCAGCGARWQAKAEPDLELVATADEGAIATKVEPPAPEAPPEPLPKVFRAKAVEKKTMRAAMVHGIVWAGMIAVFAGLLTGAALFRVDIVRLVPKAAGAYAMVGLTVNPTGLVFEGVSAHPALQDGHSALVVSGSIRNVSDRSQKAPALKIAILDKAGKEIAHKVVATDNPHLKPGEVRRFVAPVIDPPAAAMDVAVAFAFEAKPAPHAKAAAAHDAHAPEGPHLRGATAPEDAGLNPVAAEPLPADSPYALPQDDAPGTAPAAAPPAAKPAPAAAHAEHHG